MKKIKIFGIALAFLIAFESTAAINYLVPTDQKEINADGIDGRWAGKVESPDGTIDLIYIFKVDGETLTGNVESEMGDIVISKGKVNGDSFSFEVDANGLLISHKAKFDGETITLSTVNMDFPDMVLTRVVE